MSQWDIIFAQQSHFCERSSQGPDVITWSGNPSFATATKMPSPHVTLLQSLSAALVWSVHETPSGDDITCLGNPSFVTATKRPSPHVTLSQLLSGEGGGRHYLVGESEDRNSHKEAVAIPHSNPISVGRAGRAGSERPEHRKRRGAARRRRSRTVHAA